MANDTPHRASDWARNYRLMSEAAKSLHHHADQVVYKLEGQAILNSDSFIGDEARAALENARKWRAVVEGEGI